MYWKYNKIHTKNGLNARNGKNGKNAKMVEIECFPSRGKLIRRLNIASINILQF
jgi:hypothetical protein